MIKTILLAAPRGFCAGVDRAIDVVETALEIFGPPVYVKHAIVHNIHVVEDLKVKGAIFIEIPEGTATLIEKADEVNGLKVPQEEKLVYLTQTTLSISDTKETVEKLKIRFPNIIAPPSSDICYATTNRQTAARALAKE